MIRRIAAIVSLTVTALLLALGVASAQDYVPGPVAPGGSPAVGSAGQTGVAGQSLSYTGAGFNLGLAIGIGVLIVLVGAALVILGSRMSRRSPSN